MCVGPRKHPPNLVRLMSDGGNTEATAPPGAESAPPSFIELVRGVTSDVWYRRFLKPLARKNPRVPYRDSFKRRVLQPMGIPAAEMDGLHEIFRPTHVQYSPLIGMLFTNNNFIDNLYRYGDPQEPAVELVNMLFHALPGGDIQTTHLGSCAGAHLSPSIIGLFFEALEEAKPEITEGNRSDWERILAGKLLSLMVEHADYQDDIQNLLEDVSKAELELQALVQRDLDSQPVRDRIKTLEGDVIKKGRHQIKRDRKGLKKVKDAGRRSELEADIAAKETAMQEAEAEVEKLRAHIVTSLDFKSARKAVARAQGMVDQVQDSARVFVETLVKSFLEYDIPSLSPSEMLPVFTTTAILLGYIWRKYDGMVYLKEYFDSMERMKAIIIPARLVKAALDKRRSAGAPPASLEVSPDFLFCGTCVSMPSSKWSANDVATAAAIVTTKPGMARRPPIVPFSYITWAHYSEFPDCGENALRNLLNQLVYNPKTNMFDHELLTELRHHHYPHMKHKLIEFYQKNPTPQGAQDYAVAKEWIEVCSYLNSGRAKKGETIRYRREKQQKNIASPLSNVLRVLNALFGIEPIDKICLEELASHINELRDWHLEVDASGIKDDGFGRVGITDGKVRYELQSYKPVHFGFVQAETLELDKSGRRDYAVFNKLMRRSRKTQVASRDEPAYLEQLALASLFVPYDIDRHTKSRFFCNCPPHYRVLFAELNGSSQQETVLQWARSRHPDDHTLMALVSRIVNYTEPSFLPTSTSSHSSTS